ncbi:VWA domain-containing protein [Kitasatospora sp. NPDC001175]|uniref:VWA domain-containing protein n=1 Tax=Kitasatospora sp. NPDC001175 TaxID=3157103 RepID=UPI003D04B151
MDGTAAALRRASRAAPDWSGGTLIGRALTGFNDRFGRRGMARGAVVVIFSDGWEGEDPSAVGREKARLSLLAHRVIWVNPRKGAPGYVPLAAGIAAALPHCDAFVSGHGLAAMADVFDAIAGREPSAARRTTRDRGFLRSSPASVFTPLPGSPTQL